MNQHKRYLSYLLRLWLESNGDSQMWRASLEKPRTGRRIGFASLVELFAFLENETGIKPFTIQHLSEENNGLPKVDE